jgi:putative transposase
MSTDPNRHRRRTTRLRARDYASPGAYFVTLCVQDRECLFGDVVDGVMYLNDAGRAAESFWKAIPEHFPRVELDEFIVMPNHVHGIIWIVDNRWVPVDAPTGVNGGNAQERVDVGAKGRYVGANDYLPLQHHKLTGHQMASRGLTRSKLFPMGHGTSRTIGSMLRGFKIAITRWMRMNGGIVNVWQRNYHDHIIRNERSLERIRKYIRDNPANWHRDRNNPKRRI